MNRLIAKNEKFKIELRNKERQEMFSRKRFRVNDGGSHLHSVRLEAGPGFARLTKLETLALIKRFLDQSADAEVAAACFILTDNLFDGKCLFGLKDVQDNGLVESLVRAFQRSLHSVQNTNLGWIVANISGLPGVDFDLWLKSGIVELAKDIFQCPAERFNEDMALIGIYIIANLCSESKSLRMHLLAEGFFSRVLNCYAEQILVSIQLLSNLLWLASNITFQVTNEEIGLHSGEVEIVTFFLCGLISSTANPCFAQALEVAQDHFIDTVYNLCHNPEITAFLFQKKAIIVKATKLILGRSSRSCALDVIESMLRYNEISTYTAFLDDITMNIYMYALEHFKSKSLKSVLFVISQLVLNESNMRRFVSQESFLGLIQKSLLDDSHSFHVDSIFVLGNILSTVSKANFDLITERNVVDLLLSGLLVKSPAGERLIIDSLQMFISSAISAKAEGLALIKESIRFSSLVDCFELHSHDYTQETISAMNYIKDFLSSGLELEQY